MSILDLSGADTSGFQPIDPGSYDCTVYEATLDAVSGDGKLPAGTPMVKVRFAVQDEDHQGHPLFTNYPLPDADYENAGKVLGNFVNFLVALGIAEEADIKKKGFALERLPELEGKPCVVRVTKEEWPKGSGDYTNRVKAVKPVGSATGSAGASPLL